MARIIQVAVDGSAAGTLAVEFAIRQAQAAGAKLIGHAPIDEPFITEAEAMPMGGAYFKGYRDEVKLEEARRRAQAALDAFLQKAADAKIAAECLLEVGEPAALIRQRAEECDLTVIGNPTFFHFDGSDDPCGTVDHVINHPPRPVVVTLGPPGESSTIVAAYDGSAEAARALMAFRACQLANGGTVIVVTVKETEDEARTVAARAVAYLAAHAIAAEARPIVQARQPGEHLIEEMARERAALLVMGAFSHSSLHQFFFGSTTKTIMSQLHVPVFLFH